MVASSTPVSETTYVASSSTPDGVGPIAVAADSLDFTSIYLNPIYVNKEKGFKLVKVQTSPDDPNPLRVLFGNEAGNIPIKFGVETNAHGKTFLTFAVPCEREYHALIQFQEAAKEYAKLHKEAWWVYPVSDHQIEDNFAGIISARKEKKEGGGLWPGNVKVHIPLDEAGDIKDCVIVDEDGQALAFRDLPGRKWSSVMVEISGVYFQNRYNWGFGPKTLRLVRTTEDTTRTSAAAVQDVTFLESNPVLVSPLVEGLTADAFQTLLQAPKRYKEDLATLSTPLVPTPLVPTLVVVAETLVVG
jgi:hypothetical protein